MILGDEPQRANIEGNADNPEDSAGSGGKRQFVHGQLEVVATKVKLSWP